MKKLIFVFLMMFIPVLLFGQDSTTFAWDLSPSEPLGVDGGYHIYVSKQSGAYSSTDVRGSAAAGATTLTISNSADRGRYYAVATAFITENGEVIESGYSNEVTFVIKPNPPGNLRKVANVATYPTRKVKELFASLIGSDKNLRLID